MSGIFQSFPSSREMLITTSSSNLENVAPRNFHLSPMWWTSPSASENAFATEYRVPRT